jgi:Domain of unknown function (DUF4288)
VNDRHITHSQVSPVGWYVASYIHRFVVVGEDNERESKRFEVWENTVLISASSREEAYDKAILIGRKGVEPYENNLGQQVRFVFEGLTSLLPVYEELTDGAEIIWSRKAQSIKAMRNRIQPKSKLEAFRGADK